MVVVLIFSTFDIFNVGCLRILERDAEQGEWL